MAFWVRGIVDSVQAFRWAHISVLGTERDVSNFPVLRDALSFGGVLVHRGTYWKQGSGVSVLAKHDKCRVHISPQSLGVPVRLSVAGKRAEMPVIFPSYAHE